MKKLIKLMFPKTYQAIYDEAYGYGRYDMNEEWMHANSGYEYETNEFIRESEQAMYEQRYQDEYLELERLHNEHYLHEEYYAELAEEYEQECRKAEELLAEIYNPQPPLLEVGDRIHLHSKQGMYTVAEVYNDSFAYCTQYSELSYANYSDYKCHAGGKWNSKGV
jgi:hypothetical protein